MISRLFELVNQLKTYGEELPNARVVQKILISLTRKHENIVNIIEETKDPDTLGTQGVVASLKACHQRLDRHSECNCECFSRS